MAGLLGDERDLAARGRGNAPAGGREAEARVAPQPSPEGNGQEPAPNVTPEEQAAYERFVKNGYELIYDDQRLPHVLNTLRSGEPVPSLAGAATSIVLALEDNAQAGGAQLPEGVVFNGGVEILEDLANLAGEASIHDYTPEELEAAMYQGLDLYRGVRQQQGQIDQGAAQAELQQLMEADRAGQLDAMLPPGTKEHFANAARASERQGQQAGSPVRRAGA